MNIASRTPEGEPYGCPICGRFAPLETSDSGDSLCPRCGHLLWKIRNSLQAVSDDAIESLALTDPISSHLVDSLDVVELVMRLEVAAGVDIPAEDYEKMRTVADVLQYIAERLEGSDDRTS